MKLSLNWLREFIDLPKSAVEIGEKITIHTAELEEIINTETLFSQIIVGKLLEVSAHPTSEKLNIGQFLIGKTEKKQIIFGNVHPLIIGKNYPIALDGTNLPGGINISSGKIKGELSEGMVCHNGELGMKNSELMNFSDEQVGKNLSEISPVFSDKLFDIDNKSLTHRPDLMGHIGFVRELQTIYGLQKNCVPNFDLPNITSNKKITVNIQTKHCRRFMAVQCDNVSVKSSNIETQVLLENLGTRAISNVVDITNLSLLGIGQPMHAFDADKIDGNIVVRMAKQGETILALDEAEYTLTEDDIVIADDTKIISIAGIMGGLESSVTNETKNIVFESANFDSTIIRKTSARLGLRSESSMRFEKTLDPENCAQGLAFALQKIAKFCPESSISTQITDSFPHPYESRVISIERELFNRYAGTTIPNKFILSTLQSLGFVTKETDSHLSVTVPSWRATKDVIIAQDLIEEIIRIFGYHNIKATLPKISITPPRTNEIRNFEWEIRDFWSQNNFYEVMLSSFVSAKDVDLIEDDSHVKMINAGNTETTILRKTLVSNLLRHLEPELRKHNTVELFELGHTYHGFENETNLLGLVRAQLNSKNSGENFFALQSKIQKFLQKAGISSTEVTFINAEKKPALAHPYQNADIVINNAHIGQIYTLHPTKNNIKKSVIVVAEIKILDLQKEIKKTIPTFNAISVFPIIQRDISLIMDEKIAMKNLEKTAFRASKNLISFNLFDTYRDHEKLGKNVKNLAFHLQFQSNIHTLSSEEVETEIEKILQIFSTEYKAKQRETSHTNI